jgi:beta-glucosidase
MRLCSDSDRITVPVTNAGSVAGAEIVQLYISDKEASVDRPIKELKGFEKVWLEPGQTKNVEFVIDRDALSFYDEELQSWIAEPGEFKAMICASSEDVRTVVDFTLI